MYKLPRSVQVVVFAGERDQREYLLLRRIPPHGGFWQSVTGSLEEGESHLEAAVREVREETGISTSKPDLIDLHITNVFVIAPQWLSKYAPGTTHNEEVCFALPAERSDVVLDPKEHDDYVWATYPQAMTMMYWESNKRALAEASKLRL